MESEAEDETQGFDASALVTDSEAEMTKDDEEGSEAEETNQSSAMSVSNLTDAEENKVRN